MHSFRRNVLLALGSAALGLHAPTAQAQAAWPSRPITMVIPSAPGSGIDLQLAQSRVPLPKPDSTVAIRPDEEVPR